MTNKIAQQFKKPSKRSIIKRSMRQRKPPRLEGKVQNVGCKNIKKKKGD